MRPSIFAERIFVAIITNLRRAARGSLPRIERSCISSAVGRAMFRHGIMRLPHKPCIRFFNEHKPGIVARHDKETSEAVPPRNNIIDGVCGAKNFGILFWLAKTCICLPITHNICEMDGQPGGLVVLVYHIYFGPYKSDIGMALFFHSPASLHSSSHPGNRCPVPSQIWPREDSSFRPDHPSTSRTSCR